MPDDDIPDSHENFYNKDTVECNYEKYMSLTPVGNRTAQGSACYGDFFVQGYNYNGYLSLYSIKDKTYIATINISAPAPSSKCHANTLNFGNQRYSEDDYFPILYVSSGYMKDGMSFIYAYRLEEPNFVDKTNYSISLVQTITLIDFDGWTEGIVDLDNNLLWIARYRDDTITFMGFNIPLIETGDIVLSPSECIRSFDIKREPLPSSGQGTIIKNNKILFVSGVPSWNEAITFTIVNTITEQKEIVIDLVNIGLVNPHNYQDNTYEPEGVIFYNGQLMICYRTAIYCFSIKKKSGSQEMLLY